MHDVNIYFYIAIIHLNFLSLVYVIFSRREQLGIYLYFFIFSLCRCSITISPKTIRLKIRKGSKRNWDTICFHSNCFTYSSPQLTRCRISRGSLRMFRVSPMWVTSLAAIFRLEYGDILHNLRNFLCTAGMEFFPWDVIL